MDDIVAQATIFQGIDPEAVAALSRHLQHVSFSRRRTVFVEGEPGDDLYVIVSGAVKIRHQTANGRETVFAVLGPGDVFGELALFDPGPRTSTVITLTEVEALRMDRNALRTWIIERPEIAEQLLRVLARRLRHTNNTLCDLIFTDVPARVAKQILTWQCDSAPTAAARWASSITSPRRSSPNWSAPRAKRSTRRWRTSPSGVDPPAGQGPDHRPARKTGSARSSLNCRRRQRHRSRHEHDRPPVRVQESVRSVAPPPRVVEHDFLGSGLSAAGGHGLLLGRRLEVEHQQVFLGGRGAVDPVAVGHEFEVVLIAGQAEHDHRPFVVARRVSTIRSRWAVGRANRTCTAGSCAGQAPVLGSTMWTPFPPLR